MLERILVPLDGSTFSEFALPAALEVARRAGGELKLVYVHDPLPAMPEDLAREEALEEAAGVYLDSVRSRLLGAWDGTVDDRVMRGPVAESLARAAEDANADLVVMATHGRGPFSRFWLGSVADAFVRRATVPVLLIRPREDTEPVLDAPPPIGNVLLPVDRSEVSVEVVEQAVRLGSLFDARYHLVTVLHRPSEYVDPYLPETSGMRPEWFENAREEAERRLEREAERMRRRGLETGLSVVHARSAGAGILEVADAVGADLVAMGTHGRGGVPRMVLGSVADKVVRGSERPVLLYRPPTA